MFITGRCLCHRCHFLYLICCVFLSKPSLPLFTAQVDCAVGLRKSAHHVCFAVTQGSVNQGRSRSLFVGRGGVVSLC